MRSQLGLGFLTTTLMSAAVQARPQFSTTVISTSTTTHPNPTTSDSTTSTTDAGTTTDFPPPTSTSYPCATSTQWELGAPQCAGLDWVKPGACSRGYQCIQLEPVYGQCGSIIVTCHYHQCP